MGLLLSLLYLSDGTIEGRKRFQKKVCILKHEYEVPFSFEYIPYYYGPFSENLASALDNLVGLGYVLEERTEYSGLLRYTYRLTSSGEEFAKNQLHSMEEDNPELHKVLSSATNQLKNMSTPELVDLSKEATEYMYE